MSAPSPAGSATLRTLLLLAWPVVLARATQSVVGFTDAWMVAPLGPDALAATTTGSLNALAFVILPMGVAFIVQSFAAQLAGQGRAGESVRYAWYGLALAAAAMLLAAAAIPLLPAVVGRLGLTPPVGGLMTDYLELRLLSVGAAVGMEVIGNWYAGLGNTRMQLWGGVVVMVANIALNGLLIEGHLGAPALGVAGAALASTLASWLGFAVLAWCFATGVGGVPGPRGPRGLRAAELRRMLRFGLPTGLNWFLEFFAYTVFVNVVVADLGTASLAALNVVMTINAVSFMPAFGLASAGAILAGQAIGAGRRDDVARIVRLTAGAAAGWMVGVGASYLLAPATLIGLFASAADGAGAAAEAGALVATGTLMLQLSAAWQLFDATAITLSEVLRAAGDTTWPMLARLLLAWLLFVPAGVVSVMVLGGGPAAAMACLAGYLAVLAGVLVLRFRSGAWRAIELTEPAPA
jgi:MATE family multidrug resistance protein